MNTTFTVRFGKDAKEFYDVDLGKDILEGLSESEIRELARASRVITVQGKIRGAGNPEDAIAALKGSYPAMAITLGVAKPRATKEITVEQMAAKMSKMSPAELAALMAVVNAR